MADNTAAAQQQFDILQNIDATTLRKDNVVRAQALAAARKLTRALENPWDSVGRMFWNEMAIDMGLFTKLDSEKAHTSAEIAAAIGSTTDARMTKRLLRSLAAGGVVEETAQDAYRATAFSTALTTPEASGAISLLTDVSMPHYIRSPAYFRSKGAWTTPAGPQDCPWKFAMDTPQSFFEYLGARPAQMARFGGVMRGYAASRAPWVDFFPTETLLPTADADDTTAPLIVDVGGGMGHDLAAFLRKHPSAAGRLIVQDRAEVVEEAARTLDSGIKTAAHDFFEPQPVHHARAYFLHSILHNWPDDKAREILLQLRPVCKPGHSKLLIHEAAVKLFRPTEASTAVDLVMMASFGSAERDEDAWSALLDSAGFRLGKIWYPPAGGQAVLEVELK